LNTILIGYLAYLLTKKKWTAWVTSAFFGVYFAHVENIVWVSDMGNLLVGFFALITTILFLRALSENNYFVLNLSFVTTALTLMSKESAMPLGPILMVWSGLFFLRDKEANKRKLLLTACAGYGFLTGLYVFVINRYGFDFALSNSSNYSFRLDLLTIGNALYYPLNFIWPIDFLILEFIYQNIFDISRTQTDTVESLGQILAIPGIFWIGSGTLAIWGGALWLLGQRCLLDWLALVWIILGILPVIFIGGHSERHIYMASIGVSLLVGYLFQKGVMITGQNWRKLIRPATIGLVLILLSLNFYWTHIRVQNWQIAGDAAKQVVSTVLSNYPDLPATSELWFVNLPDEFKGVHFFRHGIGEALEVELKYERRSLTIHRISSTAELPNNLSAYQYAFLFEAGHLVDLTPNYQTP
jgi:hypothetical protein